MAKEREYQTILQQVLKEREQEITLLRMRSESAGLTFFNRKENMGNNLHSNIEYKISMPLFQCLPPAGEGFIAFIA